MCSKIAHMAVTAESLGHRIAQARVRASLTQFDLATAVGLDRSSLAKIESGTRRVTALELAQIAQAVGVRIESLLSEPVPAVISHRNLTDPGAPSPRIDSEVERRVEAVELLVSLDSAFHIAEVPTQPVPTNHDQAEQLASKTRRLLGVDSNGPLTNLGRQLAPVGILPFVIDLGADSADAATVLLPTGAVSVINGYLAPGRRRLALAHEIGHALVADDYTVDWRIQEAAADRREAIFDVFARALLIPGEELAQQWHQGVITDDTRSTAVRLASEYRVDFSTLARRLVELEIIDPAVASTIRSLTTTRLDIQTMGLVVPVELEPGELPPEYAQSVERLYLGETLSAARATDLLFGTVEEADLPPLPPRSEQEIWQFAS